MVINDLNPFIDCPVFESDRLLYTKVKEEDAEELFECYSDPVTKGYMNNDNCAGVWDCHSVEIVRQGIKGWNNEFDAGFFIRWSVHHKPLNRIIGTIELAPIPNITRFLDGVCRTGILRIDLISPLSTQAIFSELLQMVTDHLYIVFGLENIITKALTDDLQRIQALENTSFARIEHNTSFPFDNYYSKTI